MIKQPVLIRARVLSEAVRMCKTMHSTIGTYYPDEKAILLVLELRGEEDLALAIAGMIMERFGAERSEAKDPRFDKTRRELAKVRGKGPRGGEGVEA